MKPTDESLELANQMLDATFITIYNPCDTDKKVSFTEIRHHLVDIIALALDKAREDEQNKPRAIPKDTFLRIREDVREKSAKMVHECARNGLGGGDADEIAKAILEMEI